MRLKNINVSGFKSFVDATKVTFSGELVGVVGPNGCGKSNVIDAVRWVMGESSAKMLRGESLEDVIFNGSSSRKPVSRASVELLFDNSLGRVKSQYQDFAEISIKRILTRDGKSQYIINDKKMRRKDVLDLFRGTGLGPRSYSIIEQGMVSRIVEAKPEDLRAYVEEAAGISKYKDRRRETENRIRQTRENIERSEDIRSELLAQLRRLKRQAQAAERYKTLQEQKREQTALYYRLREDQIQSDLQQEQQKLDAASNQYEKAMAQQRALELKIEQSRSGQAEAQDGLNEAQNQFYELGLQVSELEQRIEHIRATHSQRVTQLEQMAQSLKVIDEQLEQDQARAADLQKEADQCTPQIETLNNRLVEQRDILTEKQDALASWQSQANELRTAEQTARSASHLQQSIIDQLSAQQQRSAQRSEQLQAEQKKLNASLESTGMSTVKQSFEAQEARLQEVDQQINQLKESLDAQAVKIQQGQSQVADQRSLSRTYESRLASLNEFQQASLSHADQQYQKWLTAQGLDKADVLASKVQVASGWQRAADRVLSPYFQAVIDKKETHLLWDQMPEQAVTLISARSGAAVPNRDIGLPMLQQHLQADDVDISPLLAGVYAAQSAEQAQAVRDKLQAGECIVCQSGVMYGANWVSHASESAMNTGYLVRAEEIESLQDNLQQAQQASEKLGAQLQTDEQSHNELEEQLTQLREQQREQSQQLSHKRSELTRLDTEEAHTQQRLAVVQEELHQIGLHHDEEQQKLHAAQASLAVANTEITAHGKSNEKLEAEGVRLQEEVALQDQQYRQVQTQLNESNVNKARIETQFNAVQAGLDRLKQQKQELAERKKSAQAQTNESDDPTKELEVQLEQKLGLRKKGEGKLREAREVMSGLDEAVRKSQGELSQCVQEVNTARERVEQSRLEQQAKKTRRESLAEEASRDGYNLQDISVPQDAPSADECERMISEIDRKLGAIGAVNLVAIEEYESQSERAEYLEKQHQDLEEALATLEKVIRKIDKETRVRFEETYTALEKSFSGYFPKLFGGGRASLQLTSDDWLTTGITVTAQPPGKRNSTIHLLSGGEKALTAVSLLFALFELNPAPFCMMDEVDAPLDDANVDRFCDTLKTLAQRAQIIVITHNKITMQATNSLIGVTMHEPGVSRVVSVDVDQALAMVE